VSYTASFVGGPLDGESQQVASVAPGRVVHADDPQRRAVAWTGKPLPRRPYAVYEVREHDAGGDGAVTYHFARVVR
jgi:hypothetical protein